MKKSGCYYTLIIILFSFDIFGQNQIILTFSAVDVEQHIATDSILIRNLSKTCDTILYPPDTILLLDFSTSVNKAYNDFKFSVTPCHPNPGNSHSSFEITLLNDETTSIDIMNQTGQRQCSFYENLERGEHLFNFIPGNDNLYLIHISVANQIKTLKFINMGAGSKDKAVLKHIHTNIVKAQENIKTIIDDSFEFQIGDELLLVNYSNGKESGLYDKPEYSQDYIFQFAYNIPCINTPNVEYEGQIYSTVQIFNQCWFKENLNIGQMINGSGDMHNDGIIEKYCYDNNPQNCDGYGGLYQWDEVMNYNNNPENSICPPNDGWHLPSDKEWKILEGSVDSHILIGDPTWDIECWRGYDAGFNLKSENLWNNNGNGSNQFGFTVIPGGIRSNHYVFDFMGSYASFWTSTEFADDMAFVRVLRDEEDQIYHHGNMKIFGYALRCVKN